MSLHEVSTDPLWISPRTSMESSTEPPRTSMETSMDAYIHCGGLYEPPRGLHGVSMEVGGAFTEFHGGPWGSPWRSVEGSVEISMEAPRRSPWRFVEVSMECPIMPDTGAGIYRQSPPG